MIFINSSGIVNVFNLYKLRLVRCWQRGVHDLIWIRWKMKSKLINFHWSELVWFTYISKKKMRNLNQTNLITNELVWFKINWILYYANILNFVSRKRKKGWISLSTLNFLQISLLVLKQVFVQLFCSYIFPLLIILILAIMQYFFYGITVTLAI